MQELITSTRFNIVRLLLLVSLLACVALATDVDQEEYSSNRWGGEDGGQGGYGNDPDCDDDQYGGGWARPSRKECKLYDWNPRSGERYDFIIVGAGAAGSIIAGRLAQSNKRYSILILEAGGPSQRDLCGQDYVQSSFYTDKNGNLQVGEPFTRYDVPQYYSTVGASPALAKDAYPIPGVSIAKLVGGGMGHNGVIWVRPTKQDVDNWNVSNWKWDNGFLPFLQRSENVTGTQFAADTAATARNYRGFNGPIKISDGQFTFENDVAIFNACLALGERNNTDVNGASRDGCARLQNNIRRGVRESSALRYLRDQLLNNPRIKARIQVTVSRVLFTTVGTKKVATGVEYYTSPTRKFVAFANKEVILSAGALNTPKILMLSGYGPSDQLTKFRIPVVRINENVGRRLRNHKVTPLIYRWNNPTKPNVYSLGAATIEYATNGTGFLAQSPVANEIFNFKTLPGLAQADVTVIVDWGNGLKISDPRQFGLSVWTSTPKGADGRVTLNTTSPFDVPLVDQNLYANTEDLQTLLRGVRRARQLVTASPAARAFFDVTEVSPGNANQTDAQFLSQLNTTGTVTGAYHYIGTTKMVNTASDPTGVVDGRVRVIGVEKLRVCDGGIIPGPIFFGAMAAIVGVGEKCADIILEDYKYL